MGRSSHLQLQGENVHFVIKSTPPTVGNSSLAVLLDANWNVRTLQLWERLIIDDIHGFAAVDSSGTVLRVAILWQPADGSGVITDDSPFLIGSLGPGVGNIWAPKEGISLPIFCLPLAVGVSNPGVNRTYRITGNGRIVEGTTQGTQPNWESKATPNGSF